MKGEGLQETKSSKNPNKSRFGPNEKLNWNEIECEETLGIFAWIKSYLNLNDYTIHPRTLKHASLNMTLRFCRTFFKFLERALPFFWVHFSAKKSLNLTA